MALVFLLAVTITTILSWNTGFSENRKKPQRTTIIDSTKKDSVNNKNLTG